MSSNYPFGRFAAPLLIATVLGACSPTRPVVTAPLPLKRDPQPTSPAITAADLMTRLYVFADDSMLGREAGTVGHLKGTEYIARELQRLGLRPGGDDGTFFQTVPLTRRAFDVSSTITVEGGPTLRAGTDFIATGGGPSGSTPRSIRLPTVYAGAAWDTTNMLRPEQTEMSVVILSPATAPVTAALASSPTGQAYQQALGRAAVVIAVQGDSLPANLVRNATSPREGAVSRPLPAGSPIPPLNLVVTRRAAEAMFGAPLAGATKGGRGRYIRANFRFEETPVAERNVVAIIPGSDAVLRNQYVALGAHSDHVGLLQGPAVDHDSLRLFNAARHFGQVPPGAASDTTEAQRTALAGLRTRLDSIRERRPARLDSIRNGADDDGSGSMALLEVAEAVAGAPTAPRRSLLFVWHTAEEKGLLGARHFTENPTVPRDSIVAQINIDMIGRGAAGDTPGGGPNYLLVVGSRRLSTELGDLVEEVNRRRSPRLAFDYSWDAAGHPQRIYCRSDHAMYARYGIPVVFFFTGLHGDYHQVTDEPQYIDYPHYANVTQLVHDLAVDVANRANRPVVDKAKPDPKASCTQ
ncbi:MAG: M28 family peptidase [Gemmatimonadota bacterium]|nr:M28 family peptidase [Gemmatimonadota bacterium]